MLNEQSLKTVIAVNIALLLMAIVILINFVFVSTGQKDYIDKKSKDNQILAIFLESSLDANGQRDLLPLPPSTDRYLKEISAITDIAAIAVITSGGFPYFVADDREHEELLDVLVNGALQTLVSGESRTSFHGRTWGVFFVRHRYLVVSTPARTASGEISAAVSSAVDLLPFYIQQRRNQIYILFYTLINILVLTILGTYALGRLTIRPINSLVKRAEGYQPTDRLDLFYPRGQNEFRRLSASLNRMLERIGEDKHRLENSLTSLEKANREIRERQNELIRAEKLASVGRLSAGLAHEIGNPIGIVLGYLGMLIRQDISDADKKDYVQRCLNEIHKINKIIRELLDFSRPSGKDATESVSVHQMIRETMDLLEVQPVMRYINRQYEFNAGRDTVAAVPDKLRQVFVNLILNAADALSARNTGNGFIIIRTSITGGNDGQEDCLKIDIVDNGAGIDEKNLGVVFDPFYTTKEPGLGTGLGLYVCYMIIDSMGGRISVDSRTGEGTTFTIHLPLTTVADRDNRSVLP
ncbi:MAG: ATP-binding protein [Thermodesulfobacteriota bacterium]